MIVKRKIARCLPVLFLFVVAVTSCNRNKVEQTKHIPKDATFVLSVNPASVYEKLKDHKDQLDSLINSFSKKMMNSDSVKQQSALAKDAFDFRKSFYFFVKASSSIAQGASVNAAFIVPLKDKDKFAALLKNAHAAMKVSEGTGFSYTDDNNFVAGWNNNIAIIMTSFAWDADETAKKAALESLFNLKESESIASDENFTKSFDSKADISYYANSSQSVSAVSMLALTKASDLVKDMYTSGTVNFNNGSVDFKLTTYPNKTLLGIVKKNPAAALTAGTLENFPGKPQGILDFSVNLKQIADILNYMGVDQMINPFLQKQGLSLDNVAAAFKGEFAVAVSGIRTEQKQSPYGGVSFPSTAFNFLACIPIADKKAYDKIINALYRMDNTAFVNKNGQFVPSFLTEGGQGFTVNDKYLLAGSSQSLVDSFTAGTGKIIWPENVTKNLKGKTSFLYGDIQSLLNAFPATGGSDTASLTLSKKTFKEFAAWGNDLSGNSFSGEAHLYLQNAKENSLITLMAYLQQMKVYDDKYTNAWNASDSASISGSDSDDMNTNIPIPPAAIDSAK